VHRAVFSGNEVVVAGVLATWEVDGETSSRQERDAFALWLELGTRVDVLLVGVGLSLELLELSHFETLPHRPLDDTAVTGDGNEELSLAVSLDPVHLPDDVSVLAIEVLARCNRGTRVGVSHVVNSDVTVGVTNSDKMGLLLRELTAGDAVLGLDDFLRELGVFESPEAEETWL
jgi:hypothetical protein